MQTIQVDEIWVVHRMQQKNVKVYPTARDGEM
jgi:hypothetical protein